MTLVKLLKWTRDVLDAKAQADFVARSVRVSSVRSLCVLCCIARCGTCQSALFLHFHGD